jgi:hypothetical protein
MTEERICKQHRQELQARGLRAYQLCEVIEGAGLIPETLAAIRGEAAALAETVISEALRMDPAVVHTAETLVRLPDALTIFTAWTGAVEAARPWRPAMQLVLSHFGSWYERLPVPHARAAFLAALPHLGACFTGRAPLPWWERSPFIAPVVAGTRRTCARLAARLRGSPSARRAAAGSKTGAGRGAIGQVQSDIEEILAAAATLPSADDCRRLMELLSSYGDTTGDMVMGACRLGRAALAWKAPDNLDKLAAIVDPQAWRGMGEGDRNLASELLRCWGELGVTCEPSGEEAWKLAMRLMLLLAEENPSSAQWAAQALPRGLRRLPGGMTVAYLRCCNQLASTIGPRATGFSVRLLPRLLAQHGIAPTTTFVDAAADVGQAYGPTAGQWFLERKTAAAKGLLSF